MERRRLAALLTLALALPGCGGGGEGADEGPARGGPVRGVGSTASGAPQAPPHGTVPPDREAAEARAATRTPQAWGAGALEVTETEGAGEEGAERPRDLGAELRAAIGTPSRCLDLDTARSLGGALRVSVRAYVSTTGRVTRAEVSGGAPEAVRACVAGIAESVSLAGPIEDAPRTVGTELVFDVRADAPPPPPELPAYELPPGASAPGITLPAQAPSDRIPGAVAPSSTLPAIGAEDRPPGFVPPSSTLPALAE